MTKDKALNLALEALEYCWSDSYNTNGYKAKELSNNAITAIKEALANHFPDATKMVEQEPVAWLNRDSVDGCWHVSAFKTDNLEPSIPLYKHSAPQRTWVGLTDENWDEIFGNALTIGEAIKVTEAKLKQKNGYEEKNT